MESGPATLHFCNDMLVLVKDIPPVIMGQWKLSELRRYGAVPNGFVFEGGTRCGFYPSASPACMEERVAYEASKLEKRLSLLSHCGSHSSGGDDRSLSSASSDTSHSDPSVGSRLTLWPEQSSAGTSQESRGPTAAAATEMLQSEGSQGPSKPPPSLLRCRQLQEIGRQSSSDSGIATGSHSSYSGSFSSYTGSLDICHGDEFGSLLNLSLSFPSDRNVCSCPGPEYQAPSWLRHTYDTPRSLLATPTAGLLASVTEAGPSKTQTLKGDMKQPASHLERQAASRPSQEKDSQDVFPLGSTKGPFPETQLRQPVQGQDRGGPEAAPCGAVSSCPCELCSSPSEAKPALFPSCPVCANLGSETTKYAQIDITATETAHKVGSQHAHFREERLQELEQQQQKKDGPPGSS
ncbi:hypothetical protein Chor_015464 [Crotalus horridus]